MKNIWKPLLFTVLLSGSACTANYLEINSNPYQPDKDQMQADGYLLGATMSGIMSGVISTDVNTAQFTDCLLGGTQGGYFADSNAEQRNTISNYNPTDNWTNVFMASDFVIPTLYSNLRELKEQTDDPVILAIADVIKVAAMHRVTDTYGPIPYSQIGADGQLQVPYDSQKAVYDKFFEELNAAIDVLTANRSVTIASSADNIYGGSAEKWCKFANSLKLRLAMRIRYVEPDLALQYAQEAIEGGVITSTDENALLQTYRQITVTNPLEMIWNSYNDARMGASMDSYLNGYEDPRREKMFQPATITGGGFHGVVNGLGSTEQKFYTKMSAPNIFGETPMRWLLASEVAFLKAEFKLLKGDKSGAKSDYEEGIRLSFLENGLSASDAADYAQSMKTPARFIDMSENPTKYSKNALGTVSVKWAEDGNELERIITQKWIALYPNGMEAWAEFRRTGFPKLFPINENSNDPSIDKNKQIRRVIFPKSEYANNAGAVNAATRLLGGPDSGGTRLWWDAR